LGYEALSRGPATSILASPLVLLSVAEFVNKTWELEQLLRIKALENADFTDNHLLFLNVDPNVVKDSKFKTGFTKENLRQMNIPSESIVLELTERSAINNYSDFKEVLKHYTDQGYSIAIDDAGSGYSGLKAMYEIYPKYLKIDMDFIRCIDRDSFKQAIVKCLIETSKMANIKVVAEGIETEEELRTLIRLGVDYGQGYFIQRPQPKTRPLDQKLVEMILKEQKLIDHLDNYSEDYHYVHHVMDQVKCFEGKSSCKEVRDYLNQSHSTSICVTDKGMPRGLVTLNEMNRVFAKQYGYAVYSRRPVDLISYKTPMIVDYYSPIHQVAKRALQRPADHLYDDIIVCKGNHYAGIVTMKNILSYAINYERKYAKELNPLTGLPGNVIINRVLQSVLESDQQTTVLYIDLDNFKAYNDVYGFENGDKIIRMTATAINQIVNKHAPYTTFLGHIGGDDFIIVNNSYLREAQNLSADLLSLFDEAIKTYYKAEDLDRGTILAKDRQGTWCQTPITALSIAGVTGSMSYFKSVDSLSTFLTNLKKEVKKSPLSAYVIHEMHSLEGDSLSMDKYCIHTQKTS